jgi:transposase-like protein
MHTEPKTNHKRYAEAFKRSAVKHWLVSGKSARQIAAKLGIIGSNLSQWKQKFKALPAGQVAGPLAALQAANRRLQQALPWVVPQRAILKNTWGIISEPPGGGLNGSQCCKRNPPAPSSAGR